MSGQCIESLVCLQIKHQDCILENFMSHCFNINHIRSVVNGQVLPTSVINLNDASRDFGGWEVVEKNRKFPFHCSFSVPSNFRFPELTKAKVLPNCKQ